MAQTTSQYFEKLTSHVSMANREQWELEIRHAESCRLADPTAMDILRVQKPKQNREREPMLPMNERAYTLVEEWAQMALNVEEKQ